MSLIGEERKAYILQLLQLEGKVRTNDLVDRLQVSSETIRRYLEELEEQHRLKRVYGGAVKPDVSREELSYMNREIIHAEEKQRIGRTAASLIEDRDVIYIDDGTTTEQLLPYMLDKRHVTVLTIAVPVLHLLIDYANQGRFDGDIIMIGGRVSAKHARVSGAFAEQMAESLHVDKSFLSIDGMMLEKGITTFDPERGRLARKIMDRSGQCIVMTDRSKFGRVHFYKIADLRQIDIVVSDVAAPEAWGVYLREHDVNWICAGDER